MDLRLFLRLIAVTVLLLNLQCVVGDYYYDDADDIDAKLQVTYELLRTMRDRLAVHPIVTYDDQMDEEPDYDNEWVVNLVDGPDSARRTAAASGFEYVGQVENLFFACCSSYHHF